MRQTTLAVVVEIEPAAADLVRSRLDQLTAEQETVRQPGGQAYDALRSAVPVLHFLSMTVADDDQYDPVFVLEANVDGTAGPFWAQFEAATGSLLREVLRLCKPPRDGRRALFESVTAAGSRVPVAPLLEALTVMPAVWHQGNRGLTRARILAEGKLFQALRRELDVTPALAGLAVGELHAALRRQLLPTFPWLAEAAPARIGRLESATDVLRLVAFGLAVVLALLGAGCAAGWVLQHLALTCLPDWPGGLVRSAGGRLLLKGVLGPLLVVYLLARWLRWLEQRDPAQDAPALDPARLRAMASREDFVAQNHMISIVHLKPGLLRTVLARLTFLALRVFSRVAWRNGYLGSMRTIHFAHWALISNGGRLMFHSNFDGSWESYLDDFIEKAHAGLTAAWTHGVGFPATRWLYQDGATAGRKFKAWARHSMSPSQFWFSAYKEYSVNQIERQARLANGLRRPRLTEEEARAWAIDL